MEAFVIITKLYPGNKFECFKSNHTSRKQKLNCRKLMTTTKFL